MSRSSESISQDKGTPTRSLTPWRTLLYLWPCSGRATGGPRSDHRLLVRRRRQDTTFCESHHPGNIVREGLIVKATRGRKEEGPASGRSLMETGSGQGLQQAPRRERHQSSTAGPSIAFQPLWAYMASCCDGRLLKNPSPTRLWWRRFGSFVSKTMQGWKSHREAGAHYVRCCTPWLSSSKASLKSWQ